MYPSDGDISWRGSFVKEQVKAVQAANDKFSFDVYHIKGRISGGSNLNYLLAVFGVLRKVLFGSYDFIHCHHAFCVISSAFSSNKIIYTVHEGELNNSITSSIIKLAILLSHTVIYVNQAEFDKSLHKNKHFLPCGIDFSLFKPAESISENYILFPADPARLEKNALMLKSIENEIQLLFPEIKFVYGGDIPREDMPNVMKKALAVITIGKYESDGLVLKEAMASNVPVISTNVGNSAYYLDDSSGLICESTCTALFASIREVLSERQRFVFGRERLASLSVDQRSTALKLIDIYKH
jgi:teichuronic acid biosynthesis glycosyltransferase TuaC